MNSINRGSTGLRHVCTDGNSDALIDIADEVERVYGFGICQIHLAPRFGQLYVDGRYPSADSAFAYARELYSAACDSVSAYAAAIRR